MALPLVSTLIGYHNMHPLPKTLKGVVYTTHKSIKGDHWQCKKVNLKTGDALTNSLSSKWAKFRRYRWVEPDLYVDASIIVTCDLVERVQRLADRDILVGYEPTQRTIWEEVASAEKQERYKKNSHKIKEWLCSFGDTIKDIKTVRTGLLYARPSPLAKQFLEHVYTVCTELEYPECQIVFTTLMQLPQYEGLIRVVAQEDLNYKVNRRRLLRPKHSPPSV